MSKQKKRDNLNRFVRFGKIDSYQEQRRNVFSIQKNENEEDKPNPLFIAPERRGFYAMPYKFQEFGLLNKLQKTQSDNFPKKKAPIFCDGKGNQPKCKRCKTYFEKRNIELEISQKKFKEFLKMEKYVNNICDKEPKNCDGEGAQCKECIKYSDFQKYYPVDYSFENFLDDAKYVNYFCNNEEKYCDGTNEQCENCLMYDDRTYRCAKIEAYEKQVKKVRSNIRKTFTLKDSDLIWHHLEGYLPPNEIEKRSGCWGLTTVAAFKKAIGKLIADYTKFRIKQEYKFEREHNWPRTNFVYGVNNLGWPIRYYHFEVFIPPGTIK